MRLLTESFPEDPALDTAVSRAVMMRVAAGEVPETLRLGRPGPMIAFSKRDRVAPGYAAAVKAARVAGFEPVVRLAGGRAAVFHDGTLELAHAVPDDDPRSRIHERFETTAGLIASALQRLSVDARVGEVPGEYCPGRYSVNAGGATKLAGLGQRVIAGGSHTGAIIVVTGADRVRAALVPIYDALGLDWNPDTVGAVNVSWDAVRAALISEYEARYELEPAMLDPETIALARRLADEHRVVT